MPLTDRDKRTLKVGGIIIGVLLGGFLLTKVLGGGGEEPTTSAPTTRTSSPTGGGGTTQTPSLAPSPVFVPLVRDPFSIPPGFSQGSLAPSSPGTSPSSPGGPSPSGGSTSPGSTTTPRTPTQDSATTTIGGHQVVLLDTSSTGVEQVSVEVDSTVYHPSAGESFGPNRQYMLQSVSGDCATFLFGDEAFTLCVPQNK